MKFPSNGPNVLRKAKKQQRSSKSRRLKMSRKCLEKLLKEKIKQEVASSQELELLKAEKLDLEKSVKGWMQKSEDLAKNCQKLASMVQGHMALNTKLNSSKEFDQMNIVKRKRSNSRDNGDSKENFKNLKQKDLSMNPNYLGDRKPISSDDHSTHSP